ncbi:hypothetical protein HMPREF3056_07170 [Corynebacterium sp. HMSC056F09]|uniref:hypothetical protein n=1 Tax=Corynebacterium sp. HMSC056F09 TaxID=1739548 RepID=UPI0008A34A13|nr:hypothetical protein [Corynebacterium sp. HMSC056F09]OFO22067.1 hypothetical protein HMPREF3056_07170 [Corynebacterium sp. HMSC056F09]
MHKLSSLTLAVATAFALSACSDNDPMTSETPDTTTEETTTAEESTTPESPDSSSSTSEEDEGPSPTRADEQQEEESDEQTINASQVGGDCGVTSEGDTIFAGSATSCEFAAAMFGPAKNASYALYQADPTVNPLYTANITAKSPVTGESYQLTCQIGSDLAGLSCRKPGDNSVLAIFTSDARDWLQRLNATD